MKLLSKVLIYDLSDYDEFSIIKNMILNKLDLDNKDLCTKYDLRKEYPFMLELENDLKYLLAKLDIPKFNYLQFPSNIRILQSKKIIEKTEYDTNYFHCDCWSGAPLDSYNMFLYIYTEGSGPALQIFEPLDPDSNLAHYRGEYEDAPIIKEDLIPINIPYKPGILVVWPTHTIHKTKQQNGFRISVDFRVKVFKEFIENGNSLRGTHFTNSDGVYWNYTNSKFKDLEDKIDYENNNLDESISSFKKWYIEKFYKQL